MKEHWYLLGDIHGDLSPIANFYNVVKNRARFAEEKQNIILLGDVGCNFDFDKHDKKFKEGLSTYPFNFICLRGNHESRVSDASLRNPEGWAMIEKFGGHVWIEKNYSNIYYLLDGPAIYEFAGYKTLSIPGAYSIDKNYRLLNGYPWFDNEQLSIEEMDYGRKLVANNKNIEFVISHTCPYSFMPRDLFLASYDRGTVDNTMEIYLDEIERTLEYKRWAWGHFHDDRLYPWDGDKEKLMLINDKVIDLEKFMNMKKTDYFEEIMA